MGGLGGRRDQLFGLYAVALRHRWLSRMSWALGGSGPGEYLSTFAPIGGSLDSMVLMRRCVCSLIHAGDAGLGGGDGGASLGGRPRIKRFAIGGVVFTWKCALAWVFR